MYEGILGIKKPIFGLDIGLKTMKIVQVSGSGPKAQLVGTIDVDIPEHCITKDGVSEKEKIAEILKQAVLAVKPGKIDAKIVASALPESLVFTKSLDLPKMTASELKKNIPFQMTEFFPIPPEETYIDWQVVGTAPDGTMEVLVVAAPKVLVNSIMETIKLAGFDLMGLETKPIAVTRALFPTKEKGPILLVDIGAKSSAITCFDEGTIKLTSTLTLGGDKIAEKVEDGVQLLANEANHLIKYYQNRLSQAQLFKKIILAGGGANIKQIPEIMERITKIKTEIGQPIIKVNNYDPKFAAAIGLAMKDI